VRSADELLLARRLQREAFADPRPIDLDETHEDFTREGKDGSTYVAWVDGEPAAAAYAAYTRWGLILFGGATLPAARGRGAYRALVAARAADGAARGTPALVTHAGRMSRPILERLGFEPVARIDRLVDAFAAG
jgi:GNAT superfamily N-acetyltransferase